MTSVTIEQNLESRQTYLRLKGVGRLLSKPQFSIGGDSNEMLSPEGWKNEDIANRARQCLDGDDLLLEMDSRLVKYLDAGRPLEVSVPELGVKRRIQPPRQLLVFPPSSAPLQPGTKVFDFGFGGGAGPADRTPEEFEDRGGRRDMPRPPRGDQQRRRDDDDVETVDISGAGSRDHGRDRGYDTVFDSESEDRDYERDDERDYERDDEADGTRRLDDDEMEPPPLPEEDRDEEPEAEPEKSEPEPEPGRASRLVVAAAIVAGLVVGFFTKYIADEYGLLSNQATTPGMDRRLALVQTDAFGPLADDLKQLPDKSPRGLGPDQVPGVTPLTVNPGRSYFNYGGQQAREGNKAEATYWYKRAMRTIDPEALTFLGDGYVNGDGVPKDVRTGFQLLRLGAALGSTRARDYLIDELKRGAIPNAPPTMSEAYQSR